MHLKLAAEYGCHPLWDLEQRPPTNLSGEEIGLGEELCRRLSAWSEKFQRTLNQTYPPLSGFDTQEAADAFDEEGRGLAEEIAAALGEGTRVEHRANGAVKG
jgi:hypothetical protein